MSTRAGVLLIGMVALSGCFHATIDTGVTPSNIVIKKQWASGWIFGLVPPSTIATAARCPAGVARVETKLSFLNQVVSVLTLSIYTPMAIQVTCAEGPPPPTAVTIPDSASTATWRGALAEAADESMAIDAPAYVEATH